MKTVTKDGFMKRVEDGVAQELLRFGWKYYPKSALKKQRRPEKKEKVNPK